MRRDIITMKTGIFIALAALALAVFAVPEAHGKNGRTLHLSFYGSNVLVESAVPFDLFAPFTTVQSGIAKGSGSAVFTSQTVFAEGYQMAGPDCAEGEPGGDFTGVLVLTFPDGSILDLSWEGTCCFNGVFNTCENSGSVVGGEGRFEGATGTHTGGGRAEGARAVFQQTIRLD